MVGMHPFFILGAPRSGTSLLSRILNSHPVIAVPDETKIFETFVPLLHLYGDLEHPARLGRLLDDVLAWRWVRRIPNLPHRDAVLTNLKRRSLGGVFEALLSTWARNEGKQCWGEKSPNHVFWWHFMSESFPDARVIHIVRDGRDVALSLIKAPFGPKTVAAAAHRWVQFVERVRKIGSSIRADRYIEIRYEDLLSRPSEVITRVLALLGQPFDPAVLQFHVDARPVDTDPVNNANILRPIQVMNKDKWRSALDNSSLKIFEAIAGSTLEACGYERATNARSMHQMELFLRRYVEHAPVKAAAMLRNRAGIEEGIERERIRWRLLSDGLRGQIAPVPR